MSTTSDLQDTNLEEALATYEKLQDIEDEMDDVEVEIRKSQLRSPEKKNNPSKVNKPLTENSFIQSASRTSSARTSTRSARR